MNKEIWKDIKGYEDLYQVSNYGRIRGLNRVVLREKMGNFIKNGFILKQTQSAKGYKNIILSKNGISKRYKVHRLVAEAFLDWHDFKYTVDDLGKVFDKNKLEINHKNEDKTNNVVSNLEWCTHSYNMKYGSWKPRREENFDHSYCYKKVNQYDLEGNFIKTWDSIALVKKELGINHISDCCNDKRNKAGGFIWRYYQ